MEKSSKTSPDSSPRRKQQIGRKEQGTLLIWVIIALVFSSSAFVIALFGQSKAKLSSNFVSKAKKWNKSKIADKLE